ncbi:MAG: hypothetical protein IPI01_19975 [Ignavibacteriae bacterium]|nr:hypothetical protein [Ignavibacteriota bacterium]
MAALSGRRADPQVFGLMSIAVPAFAIGSNVLMGLGEARARVSCWARRCWWCRLPPISSSSRGSAPSGAAIAVVVASYIMAWIALARVRSYIPFTVGEVLARRHDIRAFILRRLQNIRG